MSISIEFKDKYVYFGPEAGLHTQGEARAEVYDVTGPRYHDGHDLSAMTWYVRASHPDYMTIINKQLRVSVAPGNEEQIIITWPVDADFTAYSGDLDVQFVAKSSTGEEIIKLQSNGLQFAASVEGTVIPPRNMFEDAVSRMKELADAAEDAAVQSRLDADRAGEAQEAAAGSASAAAQSKTSAEAAAQRAENAAGQIEGDAEAAAASAAAAKTSEMNAAASKTAAANSASAAKTSETNAASSKTAAENSAAAAKTSETNAASSKNAAAGSASAAAQSKTSAEAAAQRAETRPDRLRVMPLLLLPVQRPRRPLKRMRLPARPLRRTAHQRLKPLKPTQLPVRLLQKTARQQLKPLKPTRLPVRLLQKTARQRLKPLKPMPLPAKTLQQAVHRQPLSQKAPQRLRRSGRKMQPDKSTCQTIS